MLSFGFAVPHGSDSVRVQRAREYRIAGYKLPSARDLSSAYASDALASAVTREKGARARACSFPFAPYIKHLAAPRERRSADFARAYPPSPI